MTWAPLGVLLSAADCETAEEEESRKRQEELNSRMMLAMQQHWNAERQKQIEAAAKQQNLQVAPTGPTPDSRNARNLDPIVLGLKFKF